MRRALIRAIALGSVLWLAACAAPVKPPATPEAGVFERSGRFALRVESFIDPTESVQGGFAWRDDGRSMVLDLLSPTGSVAARVRALPGRARLEYANGTYTDATDPDELVRQALGADVPVSGLRYWLRGEPAPGGAALNVQRDEAQRPTAFMQNGWQVGLSRYDEQGPLRLALNRSEAGKRIVLRLVVDE